MSDMNIRKATQDDFDDVMKIGDVLPGVDYLWHQYNVFIDDPNATCYVGVLDTQVVAFCAAFLIDDGQTYLIRAGRVKEEFRRQGVYAKMLDHVRNEFRNNTSIKYDALIVDNLNFSPMKENLLKTYQLVLSKAIHDYCLGADKSKLPMIPHPSVQQLTLEEMRSLIGNPVSSPLLFKSDRIMIHAVPLRLLELNMKYIMGKESKAVATRLEDGNISLLTVGTPVHRQDKLKYSLDVIGDDVTLFRQHIVAHIRYVETLTNSWYINIVAPAGDVFDTVISDVALELGMVPEDLPFKAFYLLERTFR